MAERHIPGMSEAYLHGTPTVPIKRFAKDFFTPEKIEPNFLKAVIEFVDANFWIENKIGDSEKHNQKATRKSKSFGLSDQQTDEARQTAQAIYRNYKTMGALSQDTPLTRGEIVKIEKLRRLPGQEVKRKKGLKNKLEQRFKRLMNYSDDDLRRLNSNERIYFNNNPVYAEGSAEIKRGIERRKLTAQKYQHTEDRQARAHEKSEDPYEYVSQILALSEFSRPESRQKLIKFLISDDEMVRQAAVDALDSKGWKPKNLTELTFYLIANNEWDKVMALGDDALPSLLKSATSQDVLIRERALGLLEQSDWQIENLAPQEQAAYNLLKGEWSRFEELLNNNETLLSVARDFLNVGDGVARQNICSFLKKKDTPNTLQILSRFKRDDDAVVRRFAIDASIRLSENPFYLQKVAGALGGIKVPTVRAILSVHPEWEGKFISKDEVSTFAKAILYLPPVGGKIPVVEGKGSDVAHGRDHERLNPSMIVEEQIRILAEKRQSGELGKAYIHQLTVQGRLPDEFKYVALALILSSPYSNDWSKPFFKAPWGAVAPMIHDGGNTQTNLNPYWKNVEGRTDFLQRVVLVHEPKLEELEKLSPEERSKYPIDTLANARMEQEERDRLITEAKAYQRLALALHAKKGTAPVTIPENVRVSLSANWEKFKQNMDMLLEEYEIQGSAKVTWFNDTPQDLKEWSGLGPRYEAEWDPIQKELIHLEQSRSKYPELQKNVRQLLSKSVDVIDRMIGLLPN